MAENTKGGCPLLKDIPIPNGIEDADAFREKCCSFADKAIVLSDEEKTIVQELDNFKNVNVVKNRGVLRKELIDLTITQMRQDALGLNIKERDSQKIADSVFSSKEFVQYNYAIRVIAVMVTNGIMKRIFLDKNRNVDELSDKVGYKQLKTEFLNSTNYEGNTEGLDDENLTESLKSSTGLVLNLDRDKKEYYDNKLFLDDLRVLQTNLLSEIKDGYILTVLNAIKSDDAFVTVLTSYLADLESVYKYTFEDGFGIHPYKGMYCGKEISPTGFIELHGSRARALTLKSQTDRGTSDSHLTKLAGNMARYVVGREIIISDKRQLDYTEIFSNEKTVYYPYKMLEYALGKRTTKNINSYDYDCLANASSWDSYWVDYVKGNITEIFARGCYRSIERLVKNGKVVKGFEDVKSEFLNHVDCFPDDATSEKFILTALTDTSIFTEVSKDLNSVYASLRCFYILSKLDYLGKLNGVGVRCSCIRGKTHELNGTEMSSLYSDFVVINESEQFDTAPNLLDGLTSSMGIPLSVSVYDYKYDVNPLLVKAAPMFGYKVQRMNQQRGVEASWKRILIGEDYFSGKEIYADPRSPFMPLQNRFIHNLYAGSRAGKGVMTMNLLCSAVADNKPIFYIDRKPDVGATLYNIAPNMFVVNGGQVGKEDLYGAFTEEKGGQAIKMFELTKTGLKQHSYIGEMLKESSYRYDSIWGDLIYLRSFIFSLGICFIRSYLKGADTGLRDSMFNGDDGIVIVVDELTNFQTANSKIFGDGSPTFVQCAKSIPSVAEVKAKLEEINNKIKIKEVEIAEAEEKGKQSMVMKKQTELEALQKEANAVVKEDALYAATFFSKLYESYNLVCEQKKAGFYNQEFLFSDIFVLGQELTDRYITQESAKGGGVKESTFFPLKSDGKEFYVDYKSADFIRSCLEEFNDNDWILGRNPGKNYGTKAGNERTRSIIDEEVNWEYISSGSLDDIKNGNATKSTILKAFMVLNDSAEASPELRADIERRKAEAEAAGVPFEMGLDEYKYEYVEQCKGTTIKKAGGDASIWEQVRKDNLVPEAKLAYSESDKQWDKLDRGMSLEGLIFDTLRTKKEYQDKQPDASVIAGTLARSGEIANFVASKMGYSDWRELIYDLSPKGFFSIRDMVNAFIGGDAYTAETRYKLYYQLGRMDIIDNTMSEDEEEVPDMPDMDDEFFNSPSRQEETPEGNEDDFEGSTEDGFEGSEVPQGYESIEPEPQPQPTENIEVDSAEELLEGFGDDFGYNYDDDEEDFDEDNFIEEPQVNDTDYNEELELSEEYVNEFAHYLVSDLLNKLSRTGLGTGDMAILNSAEQLLFLGARELIKDEFKKEGGK